MLRKKKKKKKKNNNKIEIYTSNFLDCEKGLLNSGRIFNFRIAKGFHLLEFYITLLWHLKAAPMPYV